jgi:hypothetical protein
MSGVRRADAGGGGDGACAAVIGWLGFGTERGGEVDGAVIASTCRVSGPATCVGDALVGTREVIWLGPGRLYSVK